VGHITLIKSTLTAIPTYAMQTCRLPRTVCDELDRKIHRFLWAGSNAGRKLHLVAWAIITKSMSGGGFGIRPMRGLNSTSMAKVGWRMIHDPESPWVRILKHKYCKGSQDSKWFRPGRNPSNAWKGICESKWILDEGTMHSIKDGKQTLF